MAWQGRWKPQAFSSLTNSVYHKGFKQCREGEPLDLSYLARSIFVCALHITVQEWHGKRAEILQGQRREEKLMPFINAFFLPSEHPMTEAHRSISRVPTASPTAIAGKQWHRLWWFSLPVKQCQKSVKSEQGALSSTCTTSPSKTTSQSQKSCVKISKGRYQNPTEKLVGKYSLNTSTHSENAYLGFSGMQDLKEYLWQ